MQKVVGSNPISRFSESPAPVGFLSRRLPDYRAGSADADQLLVDELVRAVAAELAAEARALVPPNGSSAPSAPTMFT